MTDPNFLNELRTKVEAWADGRDFLAIDLFLDDHPEYPDDNPTRGEIARVLKYLGYVRAFVRHAVLHQPGA